MRAAPMFFTYHDLIVALDRDWRTTQEIGRRMGLASLDRPGRWTRPLREALFALHVAGSIEHRPRHNGHLWRRSR